VDLGRVGDDHDPAALARLLAREAGLGRAGIVAGPVEVLAEQGATAVRALAELPARLGLPGRRGGDPGWARAAPLALDVRPPATEERVRLWAVTLDGAAPELDLEAETAQFVLAPEQVSRVGVAAPS